MEIARALLWELFKSSVLTIGLYIVLNEIKERMKEGARIDLTREAASRNRELDTRELLFSSQGVGVEEVDLILLGLGSHILFAFRYPEALEVAKHLGNIGGLQLLLGGIWGVLMGATAVLIVWNHFKGKERIVAFVRKCREELLPSNTVRICEAVTATAKIEHGRVALLATVPCGGQLSLAGTVSRGQDGVSLQGEVIREVQASRWQIEQQLRFPAPEALFSLSVLVLALSLTLNVFLDLAQQTVR